MEFAEYTTLMPYQIGLPIKIYWDESHSFKRWKHPLWLVISNDDPYNAWIALTVSSHPNILTKNYAKISNDKGRRKDTKKHEITLVCA